MFSDGKAHAGACSKRGCEGAGDNTVSAHYASSYITQSSGHFPMIGIVRISPTVLRNSTICDSVQFFSLVEIALLNCPFHSLRQ